MKILFVYPVTPCSFYSFHNALKIVSKKSAEPPLGLLTVSSMLPSNWEKKLIDMNVSKLEDNDLKWADFVFIGGMNIHKNSFKKVVKRCNQVGIKVVAGGPMVTMDHSDFPGVDHFILNEAEITLKQFLNDLENGELKKVYTATEYPDITCTPIPDWSLLEIKKYASISIQYSRGCPYNCEFCSITQLNGRTPRTKTKDQFLEEISSIYNLGWRGGIFIVDDNFIGNKVKLKTEILPALINWSTSHNYPFSFTTELSINIAEDDELIDLMVKAGFQNTFIGIETPNPESLTECGKKQNLKFDMLKSVKKLQRKGLMVSAGFIVGFDNDSPKIFEQQRNFIQKSGIITAMVGLLNAPQGTLLSKRLKSENRLLHDMSGDNMDGSINFIPKMNYQKLIKGYKDLLESIYSQKEYYERVKTFLKEYKNPIKKPQLLKFSDIRGLVKSMWVLGLQEKGKIFYWKLFFLSLFRYPQAFSIAMTMAVYGYHFRRVVKLI